jgi:hypothetical protein
MKRWLLAGPQALCYRGPNTAGAGRGDARMANEFGTGPLGFGSLSSMLESVDMVKKAWSGFSLPASLSPTMDIGELDKRIADLKTVEQWLNMNLSLLRGTIQGMEVQRGTLAAIKAFGQAVSARGDAVGAFTAAAQAAAQAATQAAARAAGGPNPDESSGETPAQPQTGAGPDAATDPGAGDGATPSLGQDLSRAAAAAVNPATWWNLLQGQFAQVAQAAMAGTASAAAAGLAANQAAGETAGGKAPTGKTSARKTGAGSRSRATAGSPKSGAAAARRGAKPAASAEPAAPPRPRTRSRAGG